MKVKDIISNSQWFPPRNFTGDTIPITVMIPNYNRGSSGLFEAAILSILSQTFKEFNLILIEDGSDDNSMEIVRKYMALDERVGCIYHPLNVGIPAISVYEAYIKTKSEYICLCFNDNDFYPNALEDLYNAAQSELGKIVYGHVEFQERGRRPGVLIQHHKFGSAPTPQTMLISHNFIPNPAVILNRSVIDKIGFFDPHISITRLNDWDYWRRCAEHYEIKPVDVSVCLEKGPRLKDSLGSVHHMSLWLCEEWMRRPRNELLRLELFGDYDITYIPEDMSKTSQSIIKEIGSSFKSKFWWHDYVKSSEISLEINSDIPSDGQILVVTADHGPSRSLYFDYLPAKISQRVRVIDYASWKGRPEEMVGATAVIFTRGLKGYADWIEFGKRIKVPLYWFTDDNHFALWAKQMYSLLVLMYAS
ncbi:glycosyltransferase family 2 protein [Pararhodospirillum photometricum]|uniref:Glycosyl transferase, family 2 n=1 Tax=Pararhodospirillum photometricum DSM 122 TaxID=1150469 RepID=H6SID5_PARPM|nr:glycosyltransferase [Pararhodospirillum photometricum]CCG06610.1 Glycosyl transferase, family 2 [Pararhodospirillum photometricum DSM 122]